MKLSASLAALFTLIGFIFILSVLFALPVMWLWNSTMPELFSLKEISLWMAWKISLLCAFLFKGSSFSASS